MVPAVGTILSQGDTGDKEKGRGTRWREWRGKGGKVAPVKSVRQHDTTSHIEQRKGDMQKLPLLVGPRLPCLFKSPWTITTDVHHFILNLR